MNSETRTKILSFIKSPKSKLAKVGIGALAAVVIAVPVATAVAMQSDNTKTTQSSNTQGTETVDSQTPSTNANSTPTEQTPTTPGQQPSGTTQPAQSAGTATVATTPTPPPAPVYADTYPTEWLSQCGEIDTWGMNKCQSVSYTAWKVDEAFGNMPKWGYVAPGGDAKNWIQHAKNANIPIGTTPKTHSVAVSNTGNPGFTMWVEAVNGDKMTVSHYNWGGAGYALREDIPTSSSGFTYIYFGDR